MAVPPKPPYLDPEYVQGQIDAMTALVLGLAQEMPPEEFRMLSLERLAAAKDKLLGMPVSESRIAAIESFERWVKKVT